LTDLGLNAAPNAEAWGGNFRVNRVEDLVTGCPWGDPAPLTPIAADRFEAEASRASALTQVTLRFTSPYRSERPNRDRQPGHGFLDGAYFPPALFARRLWDRLAGLGFGDYSAPAADGWELLANNLVWLDLTYGPAADRKRLGGAVGRVAFASVGPDWARPLVLGQYLRAGLNTKFGFGAYRIEELGPDPYPCLRATGLLELATGPVLDRLAQTEELPAGRLRHLADQLRAGEYLPAPAQLIDIQDADGSRRRLAVSSIEDRALQRAVLAVLAPGLDPLLEDSSLAYRKGLSRHQAARALADAWAQGFRWAVRADVCRFFDSIGHEELRHHLDVYLADEALVDCLMRWVRAGSPFAGRGLPTGSPLSPLLANLFLDGFDEAVAVQGGRLVRYADDFLIFTRKRAEAERLLEVARRAAAAVELALNEDKTRVLSLNEPFEFLGFRFERTGRWEVRGGAEVHAVEELGWRDARPPAAGPISIPLPGETSEAGEKGDLFVAGPGRYPVRLDRDRLVCGETAADLARLETVVLLGDPEISAAAVHALAGRGIAVLVTDHRLRDPVALVGDAVPEDPAALARQLQLMQDEPGRLALARGLVAAKLRNHAALADAWPGSRFDTETGPALRQLSDRAERADSFDQLIGLEGAGARRWFEALPGRLPPGWHFSRRVAPRAHDPINVLLNIAQTWLHRWACLAVRAAGLLPSVGLLHRRRPGHAALASDLQEPFRHLMDRAVLELVGRLRPADFRNTPDGRFPLLLLPHASQQVAAALGRALRMVALGRGESEPKSYRRHLLALARGLRRALADPQEAWTIFTHPA
jgi:group II intron reverse transcriptase/maturase/CRISPR-associated endonuclease Cas1